ncbi:MAG: CRISPR-associated ring nuclease Csm6 [Candidatus Latescibacterota bacterium]
MTTPPPRHILLAVMGESPAILTETAWHLCTCQQVPLTEVHVLTTEYGRETVEDLLFCQGVWSRFCQEYRLDIDFGPRRVHVLTDPSGRRLRDIRTSDDNALAAAWIFRAVRQFTDQPDTVLHCSIAGGRKTMGAYLSSALQFLGRPQDRLSHVLVDPPDLQYCREFHYPPKEPRSFTVGRGAEQRDVDARDIRVELADLPFVRLRHILDRGWLELGFPKLVAHAQTRLVEGHLRVRLDLNQKRVEFRLPGDDPVLVRMAESTVRSGQALPHLPALQGAYYSAFLLQAKDPAAPGVQDGKAFLQQVDRLYAHIYCRGHRKQGTTTGLSKTTVANMNRVVREALAARFRGQWRSVCVHRGRLSLPAEAIEVVGAIP